MPGWMRFSARRGFRMMRVAGAFRAERPGSTGRIHDQTYGAGSGGLIGGAGSLLVAEGGPKLVDTPDFPKEFAEEPRVLDAVLQDLRGAEEGLDWFFVSPAAGFGSFAPGERTGAYRIGGDVLLTDENGDSHLSGQDLAVALVDEIETPAHRRTRFTVAY